jgi:hypothetical protein
MSISTIIAASIILVILITEFENFGIAQSQLSNTTSSLTPPQKAAMCNPNNPKLKFGSKICRQIIRQQHWQRTLLEGDPEQEMRFYCHALLYHHQTHRQ